MKLSRRSLLKAAGGVGAGLALGDLGFDVNTVKAAALKESKIKNAKEFKSICTFCSCGCGMIGHVRDGKLINLEGDPDHIIKA
jgi:formate dehydrogenase major subunit